jgi:hypothetical protein
MVLGDWKNASFLTGPGQFRLEFTLPSAPVGGRAYIAAGGCHHLEVNGAVPTPDLRGICPWAVNPGTTVRYQTRAITTAVAGKNVIGLVGGQVMTSTVAILAVFVFDLGGGKVFTVSSGDAGWMSRAR